jgi:hypothetical protein
VSIGIFFSGTILKNLFQAHRRKSKITIPEKFRRRFPLFISRLDKIESNE